MGPPQSDEASGHLPTLLVVVCKQGLLRMGVSEPAELPAGAHNSTGKKIVPASELRHVPKYTWEFRKFMSPHKGTVSGPASTPDHRNLKSVLSSQERHICGRWDKAAAPQEAFHTTPKSERGPAHKSVSSTANPVKIECGHCPRLKVEERSCSHKEQIKMYGTSVCWRRGRRFMSSTLAWTTQ